MAPIHIYWQNLYFGLKKINKNNVRGQEPWKKNYLSEDGFEFSLFGWSLLQQLNATNKTD